MSITAKFYKITDDSRVLNKTLGTPVEKSITIKGSDSVLNPTITLRYDDTLADYNYVYLPAPYKRYYFLSPPVISPGKRMTWNCSVDVLMSNKGRIDELSVLVTRMEREKYQYSEADFIDDNRAQVVSQPNVHTIEASLTNFKTSSTGTPGDEGYQYVLAVVGGAKND